MDNKDLRNTLRETYDKHAQKREKLVMQDWKIAERARYLALLQHDHKQTLLEIGAGTGRDGKFFQEQGLETVCIDLSPAMVELCRQKGLAAYVMDIAELELPAASFDAIYCMNSLLHLTKAEFPAVLQKMNLILKPDGLVFIGVYGGYDFEGVWDKDSYIPKRFFSFFTDERIQQEATEVFDLLAFNQIVYEMENPVHFQSLTLKKRSGQQNP
jgi:SAM-dependent methyltransferase